MVIPTKRTLGFGATFWTLQVVLLLASSTAAESPPGPAVLDPASFEHYVDTFNQDDDELYPQHISNEKAWEFIRANIPLLECPDKEVERTYYFRWWTYRKHIKKTTDDFVVTEFLPQVGWSGKDYNHSTFCDLVITGLVGLRPRPDSLVEVHPLLPSDVWDWFCLDNIAYHGRVLTILWDRTGQKYGRGKGLAVFADGVEIARTDALERVRGTLRSSADGTAAGWAKYEGNPVLGGKLGTCFDVTLLKEEDTYRMWLSWRPKRSVALAESRDGVHWSQPQVVLGPNSETDWEADINRPAVVKRQDGYHMWYTGQAKGHIWIGYATSSDGVHWTRRSVEPVLSPEEPWEKVAVMCPHVLWDENKQLYRMWYSAGEQYEPNAIGYATIPDGLHWTKSKDNPVFTADSANEWEQHKVTACQVIPAGDWHIMFYIGFRNEHYAQIGLARSRDGITGWQRHPANPIIFPTKGSWDEDACYKPFAMYEQLANRWLLWYNGRKGRVEQIGLAIHNGRDLGF